MTRPLIDRIHLAKCENEYCLAVAKTIIPICEIRCPVIEFT